MNVSEYLMRIKVFERIRPDLGTLRKLHRNHLYQIPFENLDIQYKREIKLEGDHLFRKVINDNRGGFCYELNYLFHLLLRELGFDTRIISARIFEKNELGPPYDHMAIIVTIDNEEWLADVGFGNLCTEPKRIIAGLKQPDGTNNFMIESLSGNSYLLTRSRKGEAFEKVFVVDEREEKEKQFLSDGLLMQGGNTLRIEIKKM